MWANELGRPRSHSQWLRSARSYRLGFDALWAAYNFNHEYFNSPYFQDDATRYIRKQYEPDGQTDMAIEYMRKPVRSPSA